MLALGYSFGTGRQWARTLLRAQPAQEVDMQRHTAELSESVVGELFVAHRRSPRTFTTGRRCSFDGCNTLLSIYNGTDHCSAHGTFHAWSTPGLSSPDMEEDDQLEAS